MTNKSNKVHKVELTTQELRIIERAMGTARYWGTFDKDENPSRSIDLELKVMGIISGTITPDDQSASKVTGLSLQDLDSITDCIEIAENTGYTERFDHNDLLERLEAAKVTACNH